MEVKLVAEDQVPAGQACAISLGMQNRKATSMICFIIKSQFKSSNIP
jgi:hypothetical protein